MIEAGDVHSIEAYALGKILDHSAWQRDEPKLPRGITGCDGDMTFNSEDGEISQIPMFLDNNGCVILAELSRSHRQWLSVNTGQQRLYQALIRRSSHCAVLCHHSVAPELKRKICTRWDIESFQPMVSTKGGLIVVGEVYEGNRRWQAFIFGWYTNPADVHHFIATHGQTAF